jgi:hypothetical protein
LNLLLTILNTNNDTTIDEIIAAILKVKIVFPKIE